MNKKQEAKLDRILKVLEGIGETIMDKAIGRLALIFVISFASISAIAGPISPGPIPGNFIQNSAAKQEAQINIGTATIRGKITISTASIGSLVVGTMTVGVLSGDGAEIKDLDASELKSGIVSSSVISGDYPGLTGAGTMTSGSWEADVIGSKHGGTGSNLSTSQQGSILFVHDVGTVTVLAPGSSGNLLQAGGTNSDVSWTSSPTISGANIQNIPMVNLTAGTLPGDIKVGDANVPSLSGSKISGNISGNASGITGNLPLSQLVPGILQNDIVASSITESGVDPGLYGDASHSPMITVGYDGRITNVQSFVINASSVQAGVIGTTQIKDGAVTSAKLAPDQNSLGVLVNAASGTWVGPMIVDGTTTIKGNGLNVGSGRLLVDWAGITTSRQITVESTVTIKGSEFSVGGTTIVVTGGQVGIKTAIPTADFDVNGTANIGSTATIKNLSVSEDASIFGNLTVYGDFVNLKISSFPVVDPWPLTGLIVPMYEYPNLDENTNWSRLIDFKKRYHNVPLYVVINPDSGPGTSVDLNFSSAIAQLHGAGAYVLGYVDTNFAISTFSVVTSSVALWQSLYPEIDGIFFDRMWNGVTPSTVSYYQNLYAYNRIHGLSPTVNNPGAPLSQVWSTTTAYDLAIIYEDTGFPSESYLKGDTDGGYMDYPYKKRAFVAKGTSYGPTTLPSVQALRKYVGAMYVTDSAGYTVPSTYLGRLFETLSRSANEPIYTSSTTTSVAYVGINETDPLSQLSVKGDMSVSGPVTVIGTTTLLGAVGAPGGITGTLTGNADTATALAVNGSNCSPNQFNKGVDENGAAESCALLLDSDIPNSITVDQAVANAATLVTVAADTTTIQGNLDSEISSTNSRFISVAADTTTIQGNLDSEISSTNSDFLSVAADTTTIQAELDNFESSTNSQLDALAVSTTATQVQIDALAISTTATQVQLDNVAVDTTTLKAELDAKPEGHAVTDEGGPAFPAVSTLNFVGAGVQVTLNGDALDITISSSAVGDNIRNVGTHIAAVTTSSSAWDSVVGSTLTLVVENSNSLLIDYSCNLECTNFSLCGAFFSFMVDGEFFDGGTAALADSISYSKTEGSNTSSPKSLVISHRTGAKLSIGTHEISLLWASEDGVELKMGRNMDGCSLTYREDYDTLGGGAVATVSGQTQLGSQSTISLQTLTCSTLPCTAQGDGTGGNYWVWVATGTGPGDWVNTFNGLGPYD